MGLEQRSYDQFNGAGVKSYPFTKMKLYNFN